MLTEWHRAGFALTFGVLGMRIGMLPIFFIWRYEVGIIPLNLIKYGNWEWTTGSVEGETAFPGIVSMGHLITIASF